LVGHGLRERSPGYAFGAGLLVTATAAGAYALDVSVSNRPFGDTEWVRLLQIAAVTSAAWGILWLLSRRWVSAGRPGRQSLLAEPLMVAQVTLPALLNLCLLLPGVLFLTPLSEWNPFAPAAVWYLPTPPWTAAAGGLLGWAALGLTVAAVYLQRRRTLS